MNHTHYPLIIVKIFMEALQDKASPLDDQSAQVIEIFFFLQICLAQEPRDQIVVRKSKPLKSSHGGNMLRATDGRTTTHP